MTRKDYVLIANVFKELVDWYSTDNTKQKVVILSVRIFCERLKMDDNKFNATKFLNSCGI